MNSLNLRIIDANLNRSREGLRVGEDIVRFALNNKSLTSGFKELRHKLKALIKRMPLKPDIIISRGASADVGKKSTRSEKTRRNLLDVFMANVQRVKESLRVLEEVTKLLDAKFSEEFKKMRFKLYTLEKKAIIKLKKCL